MFWLVFVFVVFFIGLTAANMFDDLDRRPPLPLWRAMIAALPFAVTAGLIAFAASGGLNE